MEAPPSGTPPLTDEQSRPLGVNGASIALDAGAGCGKTMVLTARYLDDLEGAGRRPLRSIVALTFTRKAARELRQRIRKRCRERLAAGDDAARWRSVLRGLEAAPIGTFHEFAGEWLRRHSVEAGIDPDFTVLDASIAGTIRDEALARCLREWLATCEPDLIDLAVEFGLGRVRQALSILVDHRAVGDLESWTSRPAEEIVALWKAEWERHGRVSRLHKVIQSATRCAAFLSANECSHPKMRERRAFLLEHLPEIGRRESPDNWLGDIKEQAKVQGGGTKDHWPSPEVYDQVKRHFEELREAIAGFLKGVQWDEVATLEAAETGRRFARLALRFRQAFAAAKRARGGLDFDDLLIMTRDLLRSHPDLVRDAPEDPGTISRLLVDEFQDTDEVQGEILRRLGGAAFAGGRLFLVGDFKQSIYRFRGAEPRIFQEFREEFPEEGHHALTENFRSVPAILDFVNALFAGKFPESDHRLVPGREHDEGEDPDAVEFLWAAEPEGGDRVQIQVHDRRKMEARWIARRLRQRIDAGWMVRDRNSREGRRAHAGDIALLFRAMTDVGPYESALAEEGFDYHVIGGSAFYAQQEVHDLINLLSVIEDPLDAVSLVGVLRSPFFCVSDDGLYWLVTAKGGDLAEGLRHADGIAQLSPLDRKHATRARDLLDRWRDLKDRVPIAALVDRVLDESGYEAALLGEYLGARKRANARKLVRLARQFDQQGGFTVADLVARLRDDLRQPPREEQAATTDEEGTSVRLLSIHQAKGLEFPIVVLPDLNRKGGGVPDYVAFHPRLGPLVRVDRDALSSGTAAVSESGNEAGSDSSGQSLGWLTYRAIEEREEDEEALRLFYVATTRARDALILSAGHSPADKPLSPAMALLAERFDRATGRCLAPLPEGWPAPSVRVTRDCPNPSGKDASERERGGRPDLLEVAKTIQGATLLEETTPLSFRPRRPRLVDLDPAIGLPPTLARLDRLIRSIATDPRALVSKDLQRVAMQAARRQQPAAHSGQVGEALHRLRPWLEGAFGRMLAEAETIERNLSWTLAWPPQASDRTVFQGGLDFVYRDRRGDWNAVVLGVAEAPAPRERLRLLLGTQAASALGFGPIRQAWFLRLGPEGGLQGEERFDSGIIELAVREAIDPPRSTGAAFM